MDVVGAIKGEKRSGEWELRLSTRRQVGTWREPLACILVTFDWLKSRASPTYLTYCSWFLTAIQPDKVRYV